MRRKVEKNTAAKKTVEKKAVSAVKAAESEAKVEEKPEVNTAEATSKEEPEVKAAEQENEAEEKPAAKAVAKKAVKTTAAKKTTKAAAKKETAAKTTKAALSQKIVLQMSGREDLSMETVIERVKKAYADEQKQSAASIKNIEVYIKPEEGMAYYVIDGYASGISL